MKKRSNFGVMLRLVGLVKPLIGFMILAVLMGCVGFLCAEFITIFGGYAILNVLGLDTTFSLTAIFVSVVIFAVARGLLRYGEQSCNHYIAFKLLALIRDKVFQALRRLCPAKLEGRDKGDLISVITSDIELLEVFYAHTISPICIAVILSVLMSLFIGSFSPVLGVIAAFAYIAVGAIVPVVISKISGTSGAEFRKQSGELSSFVLDSLRGLNESIQYGSGENRLHELNERTDALSEKQKTMSRNTGWNAAITNTVILVFDLLMLAVSVILYKNGTVGFDGILIPLIAMMSSFGPVAALANLGSTLQNTFAAGNRVLDILDEMPVTEEITNGKDISFQGATVENLSFSYGGEKILDDLSLTIEPGKVTGISGKSGSGKSTLLKLLMRFWDTDSGTVRISGVPVGEINTRSLRNMESFVTQETQLFHDTIANNIRIAKLDAAQEEIEVACRKASVHDFIMSLPHGYDTQVGELGETLSGGERQRIGLARAFLHNAPFLLLDEPTSNLDSLNEAVILKSLAEQSEDKTIVLVSHRESTMRICDKV
ncbi:MAG: thiol reductant ABC exporter subunit CydC, partial [Ruminococcus sp.]